MGKHTAAPLRRLDEPEIVAYLAGLLDNRGGRIRIERIRAGAVRNLSHDSYSLHLAICTTDQALIDWLVREIGGSYVHTNRDSGSMKWRVFGDNAEKLLRLARPHLRRHARQADLGLMLRDMLHGARAAGQLTQAEQKAGRIIFERVASLNSRGRVPWPTERLVMPTAAQRDRRPETTALRRNLRLHLLSGWTNRQIAKKYGANETLVTRVCREVAGCTPGEYRQRLHIPHGGERGVPLREVVHAYKHHATIAAIALEFGISEPTVNLMLRRVPGLERRWPASRDHELAASAA